MITYSIIKKSELEGKKRLDAEYYHPKYRENEEIIDNCTCPVELLDSLIYKPKNGFDYRVFSDSGFPYIRVGDLLHGEVLHREAEKVQISMCDIRKDIELKYGDILFSRKGTFGRAAVVEKEFTDFIISSEIMRLRLKNEKVNHYYLSTFLNSKFGFYQVEQRIHGVSNFSITQEDLAGIKIPILPQKTQIEIGELVKQAYRESEQSYQFYLQAEQMLLDELGLDNFDFSQSNHYTVPLNRTKEVSRIDAEYFKPKYNKLINYLKDKFELKKIEELVTIQKGIEPGSKEYQEEGKPFIRVSNLSKFGINDNNQKYLSDEFYKELRENYKPKVGEILLTKDASPGMSYVVKESVEGIISSGILRLKIKENLEPEYLALLINSIVGKYQMERDTGGSVIIHWRPDQVKNMYIPILSKSTQRKISYFVRQSYQARKKAKQLLNEAKEKVERIILSN